MKMKHINKVLPLGIASLGFLAATVSSQAATLSFSASAPTASGADISNFTGATTAANNVANGAAASVYIANDQDVQGQTFTTGSNAGGYTLSSVTLQNVAYGTYYNLSLTGNFVVRFGTVASSVFTSVASETAAGGGAGNPGGYNFGGAGSGSYLTFTLATPLSLLANTVYGFDVGSPTANGSAGFFETNGTNTNPYSGGTAYTSGTGKTGVGNAAVTDNTGDRLFHVGLATIPEPSVALLSLFGVFGLLTRRR